MCTNKKMVEINCVCGFEFSGISYPDKCPKCGMDLVKLVELHEVE